MSSESQALLAAGGGATSKTSWRGHLQRLSTGGIGAVACAAGLAIDGRASCGFDSTWALVWAEDALHGRQATRPAGMVLPTAHPASLVWAAVIRALVPRQDGQLAWSALAEIWFAIALAGVFVLGTRLCNATVGIAAVVGFASLPAVGAAVGAGTIDLLFAAALVWAAIFAVNRPGWAVLAAWVGALARPEGWFALCAVACLGLTARGLLDRRARWVCFSAVLSVPVIWTLLGATLFADPLAALHVTVDNAHTAGARVGLAQALHTALMAGGLLDWALLVAATVWVACGQRLTKGDQLVVTMLIAATLGTVAVGAFGAQIQPRYLTAEFAVALPVAFATIVRMPRRHLIATISGVALVGTALAQTAAATTSRHRMQAVESTQQRLLTSAEDVLQADHTCTTLTTAPNVLVPALILDAGRPVAVDSVLLGSQCYLIALTDAARTGAGWGPQPPRLTHESALPSARLLRQSASWALYAS